MEEVLLQGIMGATATEGGGGRGIPPFDFGQLADGFCGIGREEQYRGEESGRRLQGEGSGRFGRAGGEETVGSIAKVDVVRGFRFPEEVSKKSRKSRSKSAPAPISERATRSKLAKPNRSTSDDPLTHLACENSEVDSVCNIPGAKLQSKEVIKESNYGDPDAKACDTEEEYDEEGDGDLVIQPSQNETLEEKYPDPDHFNQVKNLPQRKEPIFEKVPDSIKPFQNTELSRLLHSCKDPERLIQLMKATPAEYERLTGKKVGEKVVVDGRKDSLEDLGTHVKSRAWMNQLNGVYNKIAKFAEENKEFRY